MSVQITIDVPDQLGQELQQSQAHLPEVLEHGMRDVRANSVQSKAAAQLTDWDIQEDATSIIDFLASQPSPEEILALQPSLKLQERVSALLARSKDSALSRQDETELDRYLLLEHLVRLAKIKALE